MLVTFQSKAWSDITMFGDAAKKLLRMMGHSGTVPGAIRAEDVPIALERLREALDSIEDEPQDEGNDDEDKEPRVGLALRAYPLVQMLEAATERECAVMWK